MRIEKQEHEIVEMATKGDINAFSCLIKKYSNALYSVAFNVVRDFHLAQDITQEALIKAFMSLNRLESPDKFGSWLYAIVHRQSIDWLRKKRNEDRLVGVAQIDSQHESVEDMIIRSEIHQSLWSAIHALEEKNRLIIILFYISGLSMKEISSFLDLSVQAVESRLRRSRKRLRQDLEDLMIDDLHSNKLGQEFVSQVKEKLLKRTGQFYIPVKDRLRTADWF
jgi:RNA polymerase sigma-70 factor (ECF subfamily)